jgi:hypothetical protein
MSEPSRNPCQLEAILAEIRAAKDAGDDPRYERSAFALRTRFGVSIVEPKAQTRYSPYREAAPLAVDSLNKL